MTATSPAPAGLARFNALPVADAEEELLECCASPEWADRIASGRPYPDLMTLLTAADSAALGLTWADVATALAAHPRIGQRSWEEGREAGWSRREQAGMDNADDAARAALAEANRAYEQRFGHIYLVFASGKTEAELLAAARDRLSNDDSTERRVVREELRKIARLRLERLVTS